MTAVTIVAADALATDAEGTIARANEAVDALKAA